MSQVIDFLRNLFNPINNFNRKRRRRTEYIAEPEIEPFPKYKRVTNVFPKEYRNNVDGDEIDYFKAVKQKGPLYNELLGNFLMDQHKKQMKEVLDDGEFSDEEDLNSYRMPSTSVSKQRSGGFNFKRFYENDQQPSTSNAFMSRKNYSQMNGKSNGDDDVQFVSFNSRINDKSTRPQSKEMPSLIPIARTFQQSSSMTNGFSRESSLRPISVQPTRGRRSIMDFQKKNRAFGDTPKVANSIIDRTHGMETKQDYDNLLKNLIPRYANKALNNSIKQTKEPKQIATIDLSDDDNDDACKLQSQKTSPIEFSSYKSRRSDLKQKSPPECIDLSDDDVDQLQFERQPCLSSTQIFKTKENDQSLSANKSKERIIPITLTPVNSLKEKQSLRKSLQEDAIADIVNKFVQLRKEKDRSISEESAYATKLEKERIELEKLQQRRIDDSISTALSEKCIVIEEEEDLIDEFPPITDEQNRFVHYALHGPRADVIVSKFNMNITRHDLLTLDGLNWLNDEVINFYMELIKERSEQVEHLPKVHVMNTFFLGKLLQQGHSGVRRWTRKVDIFSFDIIPIPVHVGGVHWCMSIIHFRDKTIKYYDSMGHPNYVVLDALEKYLKDESMDKKKVPFDTSDWTKECVRDCPQQKNGSDCGVFSCQFAEFISRDSTISFEQQHMPYFRRKMICEIGHGRLFLGF